MDVSRFSMCLLFWQMSLISMDVSHSVDVFCFSGCLLFQWISLIQWMFLILVDVSWGSGISIECAFLAHLACKFFLWCHAHWHTFVWHASFFPWACVKQLSETSFNHVLKLELVSKFWKQFQNFESGFKILKAVSKFWKHSFKILKAVSFFWIPFQKHNERKQTENNSFTENRDETSWCDHLLLSSVPETASQQACTHYFVHPECKMAVILTPNEFPQRGLELVGFDHHRQHGVCRATNIRHFKEHFRSEPRVCAQIWEDLQTADIEKAQIDGEKCCVDAFLMAVHFPKCHLMEGQRAGIFKICEKTARDWGWCHAKKVQALKEQKVSSFPDHCCFWHGWTKTVVVLHSDRLAQMMGQSIHRVRGWDSHPHLWAQASCTFQESKMLLSQK